METVTVEGKSFVKAAALAKKYKYTTDYIGQLCRNGKVDAQLVGRAWFVNEDSLLSHKSDRYSAVRQNEITIHKSTFSEHNVEARSERRQVRPVLSNAAHRSVLDKQQTTSYNFISRGAERISVYHTEPAVPDTENSLPTLKNKAFSTEKVDAKKVKIHLTDEAHQKLAFEPLPEVTLRGNLTINSLDDESLYEEIEPVMQIVQTKVLKLPVVITPRYTKAPLSPKMAPQSSTMTLADNQHVPKITTTITAPVIRFSPQTVVSKKNDVKRISFLVVPVSVVVALVFSTILLGLTKFIESDGTTWNESTIFNTAAVSESLIKFTESY